MNLTNLPKAGNIHLCLMLLDLLEGSEGERGRYMGRREEEKRELEREREREREKNK